METGQENVQNNALKLFPPVKTPLFFGTPTHSSLSFSSFAKPQTPNDQATPSKIENEITTPTLTSSSSKQKVLKKTKSKKDLKSQKQNNTSIKNMQEILKAQMKMDMEDKETRIESLEEEISTKNTEIQTLIEKLLKSEESVKNAEEASAKLLSKIAKQKEKKIAFREALEEERERSQNERREADEAKKNAENDFEQLTEKCLRLQKDYQFINEQLKSKDEIIGELRHQMNSKEDQLSSTNGKLQEILIRRESLQSRYEQQSEHLKNYDGIEKDLEDMKTELFFSMALAIKLSITVGGNFVNISNQSLLEKAQSEKVKFNDYPTWLATTIVKLYNEENEIKHQRQDSQRTPLKPSANQPKNYRSKRN